MKRKKILPKSFIGTGEVLGKLFEKEKATKFAYIYKVGDYDFPGLFYYEIFKRKVNQLYNTETYPSANQFGKWAYTTHNYTRALKIMKQITQKEKLKIKKL